MKGKVQEYEEKCICLEENAGSLMTGTTEPRKTREPWSFSGPTIEDISHQEINFEFDGSFQ